MICSFRISMPPFELAMETARTQDGTTLGRTVGGTVGLPPWLPKTIGRRSMALRCAICMVANYVQAVANSKNCELNKLRTRNSEIKNCEFEKLRIRGGERKQCRSEALPSSQRLGPRPSPIKPSSHRDIARSNPRPKRPRPNCL